MMTKSPYPISLPEEGKSGYAADELDEATAVLGGCWVEDEVEAVGTRAGMACEARTSDGAELKGVGGRTAAIVRGVRVGREEV